MEFHAKNGAKSVFPRCTLEDIERVEVDLGVKLPGDYRQFLLDLNGVVFDLPTVFRVREKEGRGFLEDLGAVGELYGVRPEGLPERYKAPGDEFAWRTDLRRGVEGYDFRKRVPAHIIGIGDTPYRSRICLSTGGDDAGTVFLWCPVLDWDEEDTTPSYRYLYPVAPSFSKFWEGLFADPTPDAVEGYL